MKIPTVKLENASVKKDFSGQTVLAPMIAAEMAPVLGRSVNAIQDFLGYFARVNKNVSMKAFVKVEHATAKTHFTATHVNFSLVANYALKAAALILNAPTQIFLNQSIKLLGTTDFAYARWAILDWIAHVKRNVIAFIWVKEEF